MLRARTRQADPLAAIEQFVDTHFQELVVRSARSETHYVVQLHPAAEDVEFALDDGSLVVSAKTSTVGPGYHAFLVDEVLKKLGIPWTAGEEEGDETGYFETGDRDALEAEMLGWLKGLCDVLAEHIAEGGSGFMISLPTDNVFELDEAIVTPMGPRNAAWVESVRKDPRRGVDVFPWWQPGLGAHHALGRALTRMWTEVRFREPVNEAEQELLEEVDDLLGEADEAGLDVPLAEWAEIARFLGYEDPTAGRGAEREPTIGYRRRPVRAQLTGGWTVRIPGEMSTEIDDEGTWSAYTPGRTIWMSSFRIGDPDAPTLTAAQTLPKREPEGEPIVLPDLPEQFAYRAYTGTTSEGDPQLTLEIALPHRIAVFTIVVDDRAELEWAKSVASSVRHG